MIFFFKLETCQYQKMKQVHLSEDGFCLVVKWSVEKGSQSLSLY